MLYNNDMDGNSNFFNVNPIQKQNSFSGNFAEETQYKGHRLNGYDSSLLNENSVPQSEKLKLEYRINEKQNMLTQISGQIKNAEIYGTQSEVLSLKVRKQRLEKELMDLNRQNMDSLKLNENISRSAFDSPLIRKFQDFLSRKVLARFSKKIDSIVFLGDSLEKLNDINKNVDAIIETNIPYGETSDNYDKLSEYLSRANKIHSEITRHIGQ